MVVLDPTSSSRKRRRGKKGKEEAIIAASTLKGPREFRVGVSRTNTSRHGHSLCRGGLCPEETQLPWVRPPKADRGDRYLGSPSRLKGLLLA